MEQNKTKSLFCAFHQSSPLKETARLAESQSHIFRNPQVPSCKQGRPMTPYKEQYYRKPLESDYPAPGCFSCIILFHKFNTASVPASAPPQ